MSKQESDQKTEGILKVVVPVIVAVIGLIGILAQQGILKSFLPKDTPTPVQVTVDGYVYENGTRNPIPSISVSLVLQGGDTKEAITDSEGKYQFSDLLVTTRVTGDLSVNAEGYHPFTRHVSIPAQDTTEPEILLAPLSLPALATETIAPTVTLAPTQAATEAPTEAATQAPAPQVKTLADGCISAVTWNYYSTDSAIADSVTKGADDCYSADALGFYAIGGDVLNITPDANKGRSVINSGIYTSINGTAKIDFVLNINELRLQYQDNPVYIVFGFAPASNTQDAIKNNQTTRLKFQVEKNENNPLITARTVEPGGVNGAAIDSNRGRYKNLTVSLVLNGSTMQVLLNGIAKGEPVKLPASEKVFYIGYQQPPVSTITASVKNLTVDGNPK